MKRRRPLVSRTSLRRVTALRPRSAKQRAVYVERRRLVENMLAWRRCEACPRIRTLEGWEWWRCGGKPVHVHEITPRGRGGSIVDPFNCVPVCGKAHEFLHGHPLLAHHIGLLKHSWEDEAG